GRSFFVCALIQRCRKRGPVLEINHKFARGDRVRLGDGIFGGGGGGGDFQGNLQDPHTGSAASSFFFFRSSINRSSVANCFSVASSSHSASVSQPRSCFSWRNLAQWRANSASSHSVIAIDFPLSSP